MAIVTRYFSTAAAGAGDGTTWADRAALFSSGNWSTIITNFGFGADTLLAYVGPGTYTCSQALTATVIITDPTAANQLIFHGCDSSGAPLAPPNPSWISPMPEWDDSALPVITTTTNIATATASFIQWRLIKFTASGRTGGEVLSGQRIIDWCSVENSASGTTATAINVESVRVSNTLLRMTGSIYRAAVFSFNPDNVRVRNCRLNGVTGSSGDRDGIQTGTSTTRTLDVQRTTIVGFGGCGVRQGGTHAGIIFDASRLTIVGCGSDGILTVPAAAMGTYVGCYISGCGGYGFDIGAGNIPIIIRSRLRDNTSGNILSAANIPDLDTLTSAGTDADEFADAANGDYRIKATSALWGKGIGAGDEIPTPASIAAAVWSRAGRTLT